MSDVFLNKKNEFLIKTIKTSKFIRIFVEFLGFYDFFSKLTSVPTDLFEKKLLTVDNPYRDKYPYFKLT